MHLLDCLAQGSAYSVAELSARLSMPIAAVEAELAALSGAGYGLSTGDAIRLLPLSGSLLPGYIRMDLQTVRLGRGMLIYLHEMGSTNIELKLAVQKQPLPDGSLAVCHRQTAGKGRLQRSWADDQQGASLASSLLIRPKLSPEQVPLITLAAAAATAAAIADFGLQAGIKWPNDVVIGSKKCVGILCEMATDAQGDHVVIVGVGINANQTAFPEDIAFKATSLYLESGHTIDRRALLCSYLAHMERTLALLENGGLAALLPEYSARSVTLGRVVQVIGASETFTGTAERLDEQGALWVRDRLGELKRVLSADVSVRGVMGYV